MRLADISHDRRSGAVLGADPATAADLGIDGICQQGLALLCTALMLLDMLDNDDIYASLLADM